MDRKTTGVHFWRTRDLFFRSRILFRSISAQYYTGESEIRPFASAFSTGFVPNIFRPFSNPSAREGAGRKLPYYAKEHPPQLAVRQVSRTPLLHGPCEARWDRANILTAPYSSKPRSLPPQSPPHPRPSKTWADSAQSPRPPGCRSGSPCRAGASCCGNNS